MKANTRRGVLSAGVLLVTFALAPRVRGQGGEEAAGAGAPGSGAPAAPGLPGSLKTTPMLDAWIRIDAAGHITVFTGKAELGQGIRTALVQVAAEELDVEPSAIELVTADTARTPNEGVTAGSHSMQDSGTAILNAAANVRLRLAHKAAMIFGVPADEVETTGDGRLRTADGRTLTYGAAASALSLHVEAAPNVPRRGGPRRTLGHDVPRVDIPAKVTGGPAYVQDLRPPGMLHARVVRGPSEGTRLKPQDVAAVEAMADVVKVISNGAFLAVVCRRQWSAIRAQQALQTAGWDRAGSLPTDPLAAMRAGATEDKTIQEVRGPGPPPTLTVRARYTRPWLLHGAIGPSCALALFENGQLTVWSHTQGAYPLRKALAELTHLPEGHVRVIHTEGSGCYGHNGADDAAADAALCALALPGAPIRVQWMREHEHGFEPLGPGMVVEAEAALGADGRVARWRYGVWSPSHNGRPGTAGNLLAGGEVDPPFKVPAPRPIPMPEGGGDRNGVPLYVFPDSLVVSHFVRTSPIRGSALRSLGGYMNVVSIESLMDELALAGGLDPVALRLSHLEDGRARAVIEETARRFGWARRTKGSGFGFARYKNLAAYCAVAMQVEVDRETGHAHVGRVVAVVDAGEAVNPGGVRNQIEGAVVQAISWTRDEAMVFDGQRRMGFDWSAYPVLRFQDAPRSVSVHVLSQPGHPFLGAGEAGQGPAGAAFCNAVADALGARVRDLPLSAGRLKAVIGP